MKRQGRHYFSLHDLLVMAALAALGGVSGSAVSWIGTSVHAVTGIPGGLQFMAGIHVLWLVLAVGLVGKPGAASATGLLKGAVELLSGNPHGLIVVLMSGLGGLCVDLVWVLTGRRDRLVAYMLAGGLGAASNLLVFKFIYSLPAHRMVTLGLAALGAVAFVSGALLAGVLGWSLMGALARAGVTGPRRPAGAGPAGMRIWLGAGALGVLALLLGTAVYFSSNGSDAKTADSPPMLRAEPPESSSSP